MKKEIVAAFPFLFKQLNASFIKTSNDSWGKTVIVQTSDFYLRFSRDRGEDTLEIAPAFAAQDWVPVETVLMAIDAMPPIFSEESLPSIPHSTSFAELGINFAKRKDEIRESYLPERYPLTQQKIEDVSDVLRRRMLSRRTPYSGGTTLPI